MSAKGRLLGALGPLLLTEARVVSATALAPTLRRVVVRGEGLRRADWHPGDKIQVVLPGHVVRTYTPCRWDRATGETELLLYAHGGAPGATWGRTLAVGATVRFFGPRTSLRVPPGPAVVFGDETAFGLVRALDARAVLEVSDPAAAAAFGGLRPGARLFPVDGDRHFDALADALVEAAAGATVVLAGRARSIQAVRTRLMARGLAAPRHTRAYWADGRAGLD